MAPTSYRAPDCGGSARWVLMVPVPGPSSPLQCWFWGRGSMGAHGPRRSPHHPGALSRPEHTLPTENPGAEPPQPCSELPIHVTLQGSPRVLQPRTRAQYSVFSGCAELVCRVPWLPPWVSCQPLCDLHPGSGDFFQFLPSAD